MVECFLVEDGNFGATAFVLCMACATIVVGHSSMKAAFRADVFINFLVTIEAEFVYVFFVKRDMTILAVGFVFGVVCDDFAGHQNGLDGLRATEAR